MKIQRIVRHYAIKFAKEFKNDNPKKFTATGSLSRSQKAKKAKEIWTKTSRLYHNLYCRAYNYALRHNINISKDQVVGDIWDHI